MKRRFSLLLIFLALASLACSIPLGGNRPASPVLFQDDFSNPESGWQAVTPTNGETGYSNGTYRIHVTGSGADVWVRPGLNFTDVRIEVVAAKVGGDDNNRFGVICRAQDWNHFYVFMISSDGYYGIGKITGEASTLVGMDAMQPSEKIEQGNAINHLRVECIGDTLSLYVNGELVGQAQDGEITSGDVGLIAGTYEVPGTDVYFDNFTVTRP